MYVIGYLVCSKALSIYLFSYMEYVMDRAEYLRTFGIGVRPIDDPFFEKTYNSCKVFRRKGVVAEDEEELCHEVISEFPCLAATCSEIFKTLVDFEMHYNTCHRYTCLECKKVKSNSRLLEIHVQETHDTFFKLLAKRQPMYQCYVSSCNIKFNNPEERKEHCVKSHMYPKNCRFYEVSHCKINENRNKMDIENTQDQKKPASKVVLNKNQKIKTFNKNLKVPSIENNTVVRSTSFNIDKNASLKFIPRQVQKSYSKALTNNQNRERNVLEMECMSDIAESLPE